MPSDVVISAEGLGKKYLIGHESADRGRTLRDAISGNVRKFGRSAMNMMRGEAIIEGDAIEEFWALRDLDFTIDQGDVIGVIGRNGAGKSTLLKVLSRITEPSEGRVTIRGRVASLLEVGTGFHPELSGRENIFLNGAILGMTRGEIRRKFDEIVDFSGVERFLDTPVKRYSSGMYVRLAFAVAAHLEPEILIVDEVLAVGDAEFQKKCIGKMHEVAGEGRTVIFVSHNLAAAQALCRQGFLMEQGQLKFVGSIRKAIEQYISNNSVPSMRQLSNGITLTSLTVEDSKIDHGGISFKLILDAKYSSLISHCCILIFGECGTRLGVIDLRDALALPRCFNQGIISIEGQVPNLRLVNKRYEVGLYFGCDGHEADYMSLSSFVPSQPESLSRRYPVENLGYFDIVVDNCSLRESF